LGTVNINNDSSSAGGGGGGGDITAVSLNISHISTYWASFVFSLHEQ